MEERGSYGELCTSKGALQSRAFGRIRLLYAYSNNQNWIDSVIEMADICSGVDKHLISVWEVRYHGY